MSGALLTGLPDADAIHHAAADAMAGSRPIASDPRFKAMARRIQARIAAAEREGQRR